MDCVISILVVSAWAVFSAIDVVMYGRALESHGYPLHWLCKLPGGGVVAYLKYVDRK